MTVEEKIKIVVRDILGIEPNEISPEMRLREDLGITESSAITVYFKLTDVFPNIKIEREEAEACVTVQDAINLIERKVQND